MLVHRAGATKGYKDMWKKKGVRVKAWTVICSLEKQFMQKVLGVQVLLDTLEK